MAIGWSSWIEYFVRGSEEKTAATQKDAQRSWSGLLNDWGEFGLRAISDGFTSPVPYRETVLTSLA